MRERGKDDADREGEGQQAAVLADANGIVVKRFAGPITESILEKTIRPAIEEARARAQ